MKSIIQVIASTGVLTFCRMMIGLVIAKTIAVYAGPSGVAILGQMQNLALIFNGVVTAPVANPVVRYTAENIDRGYEACAPWWSASSYWVVLLLAIIMPVGSVFSKQLASALFLDTKLYWVVLVIIFCLPLSAVGTFFNSIMNGQKHYRRFISLGFISLFCSSLIVILLASTGEFSNVLFALAIQTGLIGLVILLFSWKAPWFHYKYFFGKTSQVQKKGVGSYIFMAVSSAVALPVSLIFIRGLLIDNVGWEKAGHWQAVWQVSQALIALISISISTYCLPKFASISGISAIRREIFLTAKAIIPLILILFVAIYAFRDIVITLLYTEKFIIARDLFAFQLLGDFMKVLCFLFGYPMISRGASRWYIFNEIAFSLLFVLLSYGFVEQYGIEGIPIAYALNYFLCLLFLFANFNRFAK